jgi:hypothetical protein
VARGRVWPEAGCGPRQGVAQGRVWPTAHAFEKLTRLQHHFERDWFAYCSEGEDQSLRGRIGRCGLAEVLPWEPTVCAKATQAGLQVRIYGASPEYTHGSTAAPSCSDAQCAARACLRRDVR